MTVRDAYEQWADTYDHGRNLTRDLDDHATRTLLGDRRFTTTIEAGCGTGKNTPFYRSRCQQLFSLDMSEAMLARARARPGTEGTQFLLHDLQQRWPVPEASADLVAFNLVLEHVDSLHDVLQAAALASVPGAALLISELHPFRQYLGSQARFESPHGETRVPAFVHHVSDFHRAARDARYRLTDIREWWHQSDSTDQPPRLLTLLFERQ